MKRRMVGALRDCTCCNPARTRPFGLATFANPLRGPRRAHRSASTDVHPSLMTRQARRWETGEPRRSFPGQVNKSSFCQRRWAAYSDRWTSTDAVSRFRRQGGTGSPFGDQRSAAALGPLAQQCGIDVGGVGKIRLKCERHVLQSFGTGPLRCAVRHGSASSEAAGQLTCVLPVHRPSFGWQIWTGFKKSIKNKNLFQVVRCFPDG